MISDTNVTPDVSEVGGISVAAGKHTNFLMDCL